MPAPTTTCMLDAAGQSVRAGNVVAYSGYVDGSTTRQRLTTVTGTRQRPLGDGTSYWIADLVIDGVPIATTRLQIVRVGPLDALEGLRSTADEATRVPSNVEGDHEKDDVVAFDLLTDALEGLRVADAAVKAL